jgi:hypothetical protein
VAAVSAVAESPSSLAVATRTDQSVVILTVEGVLDTSSSPALRDIIMKATLDEPSAVIVNVSGLRVPAESHGRASSACAGRCTQGPPS